MSPTKNGRLIFKSVPKGYPVPGETTVYDTEEIDLDTLALNGGVLVKALYLSVDPYLRGRMREATAKSYSGAFALNKPISGFGVGRVLRSEKEGVKEGDNVWVPELPFQQYSVLSAKHPVMVIKNENNVPLSAYLSVLGMPGKTAYYALEVIGQPKAGETIYVSTGAGPVGSTVSQLAKSAGLKVIASAGSDDKVEYLRSIGVDVAFNYKKTKIADVLDQEGPIDIYWDNVGGESLEAAINACRDFARIIVCGAISAYNGGEPYGIKNTMQILTKRLTVRGFIQHELETQVGKPQVFYEKMTPLVASGQIKWNEQIYEGLEKAGDAILDVQKGDNTAKAVVKVADA
ncbi:Zinc-binding dehydrogenase [Ceratobasidium sp. AG-Ba]|nr:Zinc-binding dehydrogenase [Ceratobasidium sp. AG-Ba]QRV98759.1 Zinc-binding dehydrogenase [Ceratobasidium sp. AG-Ba]